VSEVLDRLADILGLGLDLIGGAVGLELVVIGDVADGLLGASTEVFGLVLELVVNTHGTSPSSIAVSIALSNAAMLRIVPSFALYATSPAGRRRRSGYARASQLCSCSVASVASVASERTTGTMASRNWLAQRRMSESVMSLASNPVPAIGLGTSTDRSAGLSSDFG